MRRPCGTRSAWRRATWTRTESSWSRRVPDSFTVVTPQGASIVELFWLAMIPSALILAIVIGGIVVVLVRDRGGVNVPDPDPRQHGRALEITWTAIPLVLVIIFFGL